MNKTRKFDRHRMSGVMSIHDRVAMRKALHEYFEPGIAAGNFALIDTLTIGLRAQEKQYKRFTGLYGKNYRAGWTDGKVNGDREIERRQRQIAKGMLRRENGLVA